MTRRSVYAAALVVFLAACAMTLTSIILPRWIGWNDSIPTGPPVHYTYGLHSRCSSLTGKCSPFPQASDCHNEDRYFCSMWRSVGFLMSFAVVIEGVTLTAFVVMIAGGKQKRESGWKMMSTLLVLVGALQLTGMALIAHLHDNDDRFYPGWDLDVSWYLCTISWSLTLLLSAGIAASSVLLSPEGGYELIPGEQ